MKTALPFALALALTLLAAPVTAKGDALSEAVGKYEILANSHIGFRVAQVGGGGISGTFSKFSGEFALSSSGISASKVQFTLFPESVDTPDNRMENFLRSSAVFDVASFPMVIFRSTKITQTSATSALIEGMLTARGITKPARFQASLMSRGGNKISFQVTGIVRRAPFGMDVGTPIYKNEVEFDMVLNGKR